MLNSLDKLPDFKLERISFSRGQNFSPIFNLPFVTSFPQDPGHLFPGPEELYFYAILPAGDNPGNLIVMWPCTGQGPSCAIACINCVECGPVGVEDATWGSVKGLYR